MTSIPLKVLVKEPESDGLFHLVRTDYKEITIPVHNTKYATGLDWSLCHRTVEQ